MKLKVLNIKKIKKSKSKKLTPKSYIQQKKDKAKKFNIPLEFFKSENHNSFEDILNSLPDPIKQIISNGNNPIGLKHNSNIIEVKTDTNLVITIKTQTLNNKIPKVKIVDKNTKTTLLNTFK